MSTRPRDVFVPHQVVDGDSRHGVVRYARQLRGAVTSVLSRQHGDGVSRLLGGDAPEAVHVHFTDKLFGNDPQAAADRFRELARTHAVSVTLHDLPQDSDGRNHVARQRAYAQVVADARAVVCNSHHELALLEESTRRTESVRVIPLPLVSAPAPPPGRSADPGDTGGLVQAAVLGFYYPGKGHDDVVDALLELRGEHRQLGLAVLGAASAGHDDELAELVAGSRERGLRVEVTGYLDDEELALRVRTPAVPVVAHQHVSASGSLNSWIAAGRRPLVRDSRYAREMEALRPNTMTRYPPGGLAEAIRAAADDPASTWLTADAVLTPGLPEVAAAYLDWWREDVPW